MYQSWSVVFGEQPSATKWNILGTNDAAFNDDIELLKLGWIEANETWTYSSVSGIQATITVPSGATSRYQVGDKIRLKQGGGYKYFFVINVTSTTLVVTGGIDYTLTNTAITDNYYSRSMNAHGFPEKIMLSQSGSGGSATARQNMTMNGQRMRITGFGQVTGTNADRNSLQVNYAIPFKTGGTGVPDLIVSGYGEGGSGLTSYGSVSNKIYGIFGSDQDTTKFNAGFEQRSTGSANGAVVGFGFVAEGPLV